MPSDTLGFSGQDIVNRVCSFIGTSKQELQTYIAQTLPLAEFRYCKMAPWRFLYKTNLSLTVASGTNEYDLTTSTLGYYMSAEDVETIYDQTNGIVLKKTTVKDLRRLDPKSTDGSAAAQVAFWAPLSDNRIMVYPKVFSTTVLKVDGKVSPGALSNLSNYPTIPYKYQEAFIQYVLAMALDKENDDRAESKKKEALSLIIEDVRDDNTSIGDVDQPRIRSQSEAIFDGIGGANLEQFYFNSLFR